MVTVGQVVAYPSVRRYLTASAVSHTGYMLMITALFKQAFDISGSTLVIGFIGLAQFLPALLLVLVSGWFADRFDRRRITAIGYLVEAACTAGLLVFALTDPTVVWPLYLVALAFGTADAMIAPAVRSLPPLVSPPGLLPRVIALNAATFTGATIVGPAASGFLYAIDPAIAYAAGATLLLVAVIPMALLPLVRHQQPSRDRPTLHAALEGLRFVRRTPVVLGAIALDLFAVLFGGAVALIPSVAEERLGVGDVAYGWLRAAPGVGAALMAVVLAIRPVRRHVGPVLLVVVAVFGLATMAFGLTTNYAVAFLALVVLAAADMVSMFIRGALVPLVTPDEQLGRVVAVESVFIGASNELGAFESGVAAHVLGLPLAIAGGGAATVVIAGLWVVLFPSIRRIDTFEELEASHRSARPVPHAPVAP